MFAAIGAAIGSGMGSFMEIMVSIGKIFLRATMVVVVIVAFAVLLNMAIVGVNTLLNGSMLLDLFAFIQIWLPFNLNAVLTFIVTGSLSYFTYNMAVIAYEWTHRVLGNG